MFGVKVLQHRSVSFSLFPRCSSSSSASIIFLCESVRELFPKVSVAVIIKWGIISQQNINRAWCIFIMAEKAQAGMCRCVCVPPVQRGRYLLCVPAHPLTPPVIEPSLTHRWENVFIDSTARKKNKKNFSILIPLKQPPPCPFYSNTSINLTLPSGHPSPLITVC